ncbi:MAG: TonB-dependent receptor [Holophaga sp.]|nr:TonB-dependent receptor [Holophaga sp.]
MRCALALLLGLPSLLVAQSNTTGALGGVVKDGGGVAITGAIVRIQSDALIGRERSLQTETTGAYRFPALPPGAYRVTVEAPGFVRVTSRESVVLGRSATVHFVLRSQATAGSTVEVTAVSVQEAASTTTQNFTSETLQQLPTAGRSLSDLLSMTPGINRGMAWGGAGSGSNAYLMDGINVGDTSGGTQWIYTNMDWFDEVQVGGLGAGAEFGGFSGGFINTVVKRGGNAFSGTVSSYYDATKWQARSSNRDWPWAPAETSVPEAENYDLSASLGGAIVQDRLWYFVSAQREKNGASYVGSLPTGPLPSRTINSSRFLAKLTWQVVPTATLEGLFEYDTRAIDHKYVNQSWGQYEAAAGGRQTSPSRYYNLTWTQTLNSTTVLTAKANGYQGSYDILPEHGETNCLDIDGNKFFNNLDIAERNRRGRASLAVTLDHFRTGVFSATDSHAFRFGFEREQGYSESEAWNPGGYVLTADTDDLVNGVQTYRPYGAYTIGVENVRIRSNRLVVFAQDTWTVSDRLTLRPGLRFEQNQLAPYGGTNLWNTRTLAPRFGGTLSLSADQKHLLKFHWGRYFDGVETGYISRSIPGAVAPVQRWYWDDAVFTDLRNPPMVVGLDFRDARTSFTNLDPKANQPYAQESTLAYELRWTEAWTLSLSGVYRKWNDMLVRIDRNETTAAGYQIYNPMTQTFLPFFDITNAGSEDYYVTNDSRAKRAYWAVTVGAERKFKNRWSLSGSYTRARSTGNVASLRGGASTFENANNQINADGLLSGFSDHELKMRGTVELPRIGTRLSGTFTYLSGEHWTPTLSVNDTRQSGAWMYWAGSLNAAPRGAEIFAAQKLLNLRIAQPLFVSKQLSGEVYVEVINLLNDCATLDLNTRLNRTRLVNTVDTTLYSEYRKPSLLETSRRLRVGFRLTF